MKPSHPPRRSVPGSVYFHASEAGSWVADVTVDRKRRRIGRFNTRAAAEAALAADYAATRVEDSTAW